MQHHLRQPETMARQIPSILVYLVHVDSLLAMGVLAILLSALEWFGSLPDELAWLATVGARVIWCGYFFLVARKARLGKLRLPVFSDFRDTKDALLRPLIAAAFYALLMFGLVYLPVALLGALTGAPRPWHHLDPLRGFRLARRVPRAFSFTFAILTLLTLVGFLLEVVSVRLAEALPIPLAGPVIRQLLRLWVPLAQARLLGGFVHHNLPFLAPRDAS